MAYVEIEEVDRSLGPAQRTRLGLGPPGSDPRDTAVRVLVVVDADNGVRAVASFSFAYERAATTRGQLRNALIAEARLRIAADIETVPDGRLVGSRFRFE